MTMVVPVQNLPKYTGHLNGRFVSRRETAYIPGATMVTEG